MLTYSLYISSVTKTRFLPIAKLIVHAFDNIIRRISIGKSVRHEHVKHVIIAKSYTIFAFHGALFKLIRHAPRVALILKLQHHSAWLRTL